MNSNNIEMVNISPQKTSSPPAQSTLSKKLAKIGENNGDIHVVNDKWTPWETDPNFEEQESLVQLEIDKHQANLALLQTQLKDIQIQKQAVLTSDAIPTTWKYNLSLLTSVFALGIYKKLIFIILFNSFK